MNRTDTDDNRTPVPEREDTSSSNLNISRRAFIGVTTAAAATLLSWPAEADSPGVDSGSIFKIHPAIGIARMGNAPSDTFFIGP